MSEPNMSSLALRLAQMSLFFRIAWTSQGRTLSKRLVENHSNGNPDFCITQATRLRPASMLELSNGSCLMFDIHSLSENTIPLYSRVQLAKKLPLLRIFSPVNRLPMDVLNSGEEDAVQFNAFGDTSFYRSKYLSSLVSLQPNPFSSVDLVFLINAQNVKVNLTFETTNERRIQEAHWFDNQYLQASTPWDLQELKDENKFFQLYKNLRSDTSKYTCQFYIGNDDEICDSLGARFYITNEHVFLRGGDSEENISFGELQLIGRLKEPGKVRFYHQH